MQGNIAAVKSVLPNMEHRSCIRHMYANFKKHNKEERLVECYQGASKAITESEFQYWMNKLKKKDEEAYHWLYAKDSKLWTKSHYL